MKRFVEIVESFAMSAFVQNGAKRQKKCSDQND